MDLRLYVVYRSNDLLIRRLQQLLSQLSCHSELLMISDTRSAKLNFRRGYSSGVIVQAVGPWCQIIVCQLMSL